MFFLAIVMCVMCFGSLTIGTTSDSTSRKFELPTDVSRQPLLIKETSSSFGILQIFLILMGLLSGIMAY